MRRSFGAGRHHDEPAVAHAALADDMLGEMLDLRLRPAQQRDLQAALGVDMDMHGGDGEIAVAVMIVHQPLRQLPRFVIIDIDQRRHAAPRAVVDPRLRHQARANEIAHRLGAVLMARGPHVGVEAVHQFVVDGHGHALHRQTPDRRIRRKSSPVITDCRAARQCASILPQSAA